MEPGVYCLEVRKLRAWADDSALRICCQMKLRENLTQTVSLRTTLLASGHSAYYQKRLNAFDDSAGQCRVGRFVREILFTGVKPDKRTPL